MTYDGEHEGPKEAQPRTDYGRWPATLRTSGAFPSKQSTNTVIRWVASTLSHASTDMKHHEELISNAMEQLGQIFKGSKRSTYLYLDKTHKSCNSNFSKLLGYSSPEEWARMDVNFPEVFVSSKSRKTLVTAYQKGMEEQIGSTIIVAWKRTDGKEVSSEVILVPYSYGRHLMALHFITKKAAKRQTLAVPPDRPVRTIEDHTKSGKSPISSSFVDSESLHQIHEEPHA